MYGICVRCGVPTEQKENGEWAHWGQCPKLERIAHKETCAARKGKQCDCGLDSGL